MRTLTSTLQAAIGRAIKQPVVKLTCEDHIVHLAAYQAPGTADAWNDACVANDGSIVRCSITRSNGGFLSTIQCQRVTDPTQGSQWTTWTTLVGGSGNMSADGGCAISNNGGTLRIFGQRGTGGNNLYCWTSTDNGNSWSGPTTVISLAGNVLTKGVASAGNNDVFFLYDVVGGEAMGCCFYSGGSWSALTSWSLPTIAEGVGLAVSWNTSLYSIAYSDGYALKSCTYTPQGSTWAALPDIAPATTTAIGRISPRVYYDGGLYWLTCVESDGGTLTGVTYNYPRIRQSADFLHWSNGTIAHDLGGLYGACLLKTTPPTGSAGTRYYLFNTMNVQSTPVYAQNGANMFFDASAAVLRYQKQEKVNAPTRLDVYLDNAKGALNGLVAVNGTYGQPIGPNTSLVLSEGYLTPSNEVVKVGMYHVSRIEFLRTPEESLLHLVAYDLSRNLDTVSRYQMTYLNQNVQWLVTELCARAGLYAVSISGNTQLAQIVPSFVLHAGQPYRAALNELTNTYGLDYFLDQNETMQFRELSASDTSVWSYQPEIEMVAFGTDDLRGNHVIISGKPPTNGNWEAITTGEAYDDSHMHAIGMERVIHHADIKLTSTAQCNLKANLLLAQEQRSQITHTVAIPLNPGLQLLDVITLTDSGAPTGSGQGGSVRIIEMVNKYDAQHAVFEQNLHLEGR